MKLTLKSHSAGALNTFLRDFIPLYRHAEQMLRRPASSSFTRWLRNIMTWSFIGTNEQMVLGKRRLFYLELSHYHYWGLFKGKGSTGSRLLYDHIRFGWREMWAEIFRRQRGSTCISGAAPFWTSLIPRCSVLGARLFGGSPVRIISRLQNNICVCELRTFQFTHWHLAKL